MSLLPSATEILFALGRGDQVWIAIAAAAILIQSCTEDDGTVGHPLASARKLPS